MVRCRDTVQLIVPYICHVIVHDSRFSKSSLLAQGTFTRRGSIGGAVPKLIFVVTYLNRSADSISTTHR